jgi:hypothetical protein
VLVLAQTNQRIVVLFTAALFLSGYVLQQKTVRDLRTAIRPQAITMQDRLYLPPQFENPPIQVRGDDESEVVINVKQGGDTDHPDTKKGKKNKGSSTSSSKRDIKQEGEEGQRGAEESPAEPSPGSGSTRPSEDKSEKPLSRAARRKKIKDEILAAGEGEGFKGYRRRMW